MAQGVPKPLYTITYTWYIVQYAQEMNNMILRNHVCRTLRRWADETARAEDAAGYMYCDRGKAVRKLGRIHYAIWVEDLHKEAPVTLGDCLWCACTYGVEILYDLMRAPLNIAVCKRR